MASGDGTKTVYVKYKDVAGNWSIAYSSSILLDTVAPIVTISSPVAGFTNTNTPTLSYAVSDGTVVVKVDSNIVSKASGSTLDPLADGPHSVRVESMDAAGNPAYAEVSFTVDTAAPIVTISSPVTGFTNTNTPTLSYTVSDGTVVVKVDSNIVFKTTGSTLDPLPDGPHTVRVEATDAAGNTGFAEVSFAVDTIAPVVMISSPVSGVTNTNAPTLSYTVSDGTVVVKVDGTVVSKVSGDNLDTLTDGPHKVRVESTDAAGNTGFAEVDFTVNTQPPTVHISSPVTGLTSNKTPLLIYELSYGTARVTVDGKSVNTVSGYNLDSLSEGPHTVRVEATSGSGTGFDEVTFTVDSTPPLTPGMPRITKISAGEYHSLAIAEDGSLWAWGANNYGSYGNGTTTSSNSPVMIGTDKNWVSVAAGVDANIGLKSDGTLWAWGWNGYGQLGDGTIDEKHTPVQIGSDTNWKAISMRGFHAVALKHDGSLWAWGYNGDGELGDGTTDNKYVPVQIGTDADWAVVSAGPYHTLAVKSNGTLWAWGWNWYGQLGDGTWDNKYVPVQIGNDRDWIAIDQQDASSFALKSNHSLWAWGSNAGDGMLGDGTLVDQYTPIQIGSDINWTAIAASGNGRFTLALKSDGTLWGWGANWYGQLGDGTYENRSKYVPTQIGSDNTWTLISAGFAYGVAAKSDGKLWTWGINWNGQLGDGTTQDSVTPHYIYQTNNALVINSGEKYTSFPAVTLKMNAWDTISGLAFMQFSNDGITWSSPEPFASIKNWTLSPGDGVKTVYVMFQDAAGNWSSAYSSSIILDTTAPVVTITSPMSGSTNNNMPLLSYAVSDATSTTVAVKLDGLTINKVSGEILDPLSPSTHILRVEATDTFGHLGYADVTFTVNPVSPPAGGYLFSDVALSNNTLNTCASESSTIFFTINGPATVALKIIPEKQGPNGTPVYQTSQVCPAAGPYLFTWDGHDTAGRVVPDEAYLYILVATDGANTVIYSPAAPTGTGIMSCSQGAGYDTYRNEPLTISYTVSQPARVDLGIDLSGGKFKIMSSVPHAAGSYTLDWNGRSVDGRILDRGGVAQCAVASLLRENVIITSGDTPKVSLLKTDPYDIQLSYGEFTRISYALSRDANVTLKLIPTTGVAITVLNGQLQSTGAHEIEWNGIDPSDVSGKNLQILKEGDYIVSIQAANPVTGRTSDLKGCLRVWR